MMLLGKPIKIIRLFSVSSRLSLYLPEYKNAKNMSGNHNHAHLSVENTGRAFVLGIALNIVFVAVEAGAGLYLGSLALLSDAGHNLSDVVSLVLALLAFRMMMIKPSRKYTYGYKKMTVLVSLVNGMLLVGAVAVILWQSVEKLMTPQPVEGGVVAWVAGVGIVVNAFTAFLFFKGKDKDLNVKGAYLHMAADTLVSVGVLAGGIVIKYTGWYVIDPIIGIVVAAGILFSTWGLLRDSVVLALDGVPRGLDVKAVKEAILGQKGVKGVHHMHVWALSTTQNALTAHIVVGGYDDEKRVKDQVKHVLHDMGIDHATLELEVGCEDCPQAKDDIYD